LFVRLAAPQSCTKAKRALDSFKSSGLKYSLVELDTHKDGAAIQGAVGTLTGRRTVPNVFINGKSIGGGDETASAHSSGELKEMLKACGAITA